MIRFVRDCVVAVIAYVNVATELFCPTLLSAMRDKGYDKHDEAQL